MRYTRNENVWEVNGRRSVTRFFVMFFVRSHVDFRRGERVGRGGHGEIGDGVRVRCAKRIDERATGTATIERWE